MAGKRLDGAFPDSSTPPFCRIFRIDSASGPKEILMRGRILAKRGVDEADRDTEFPRPTTFSSAPKTVSRALGTSGRLAGQSRFETSEQGRRQGGRRDGPMDEDDHWNDIKSIF